MNGDATIFQAELTWTGSRFERDVALHVRDGRIEKVVAKPQATDQSVVKLDRRALLPGFVNAHSHAFQRGLRCEAQRFDSGAGNFWTWRETMYRLVDSLDVDRFYEISKQCFEEMLAAGITSVGEFHYVHQHPRHRDAPYIFDDAIINAARDAGIRMALIQTYYGQGAIGKELEGAQTRFAPISRDAFLRQFGDLMSVIDAKSQTLALACHSVRAVGLEDLRYLHEFVADTHFPFHIHVEEARKEIDDCVAAYGVNPLRLLLDKIRINHNVTAIHCTHSNAQDLREFITRGGRICLCPITEGNLSDGFPDLPTIRDAGGKVCIGTDSNIRISMTEELRWLEFAQRLRREQRGIVVDQDGLSARALFEIGTRNGADSLRLNCGAIEPGRFADLVAIDLDHPSMRGASDDAVLDSLIFGSGNGPIDRVWVNGREKRNI